MASVVAVASTLVMIPAQPGSAAPGALAEQVDVAVFSNRAAEWTRASVVQRADALTRANQLGADAKQAEETAEAEEAARIQEEIRAAEAEARRLAEAAAQATTTPPTTLAPTTTGAPTATDAPAGTVAPSTTVADTTTTAAPDGSGAPSAAQWEALRQCESGGRYDAVNPNGRYRGAYQFSRATWDWVAGIANSALIGIDPAAAAPADQDAQALALWNLRGSGPWPTCGVHLN